MNINKKESKNKILLIKILSWVNFCSKTLMAVTLIYLILRLLILKEYLHLHLGILIIIVPIFLILKSVNDSGGFTYDKPTNNQILIKFFLLFVNLTASIFVFKIGYIGLSDTYTLLKIISLYYIIGISQLLNIIIYSKKDK